MSLCGQRTSQSVLAACCQSQSAAHPYNAEINRSVATEPQLLSGAGSCQSRLRPTQTKECRKVCSVDTV